MRLPARLTGLFLAVTLALAGCSDDEQTPASSSESPSASAPTAEEPYLEVPEGVELTAQGSTLDVGETATVAYLAKQELVGALDIKVTSLEKATWDLFAGWDVKKESRTASPYFVRASITNVGATNLGELEVPLYMVDDQNRLVELSPLIGSFKPCDGEFFPKKFRQGDTVRACMVYLAPDKGDLTAVSFRPTQEFNPIIWEGDLEPAQGTRKDRGRGAGKGGGKGGATQRDGRGKGGSGGG